jgi:hypothetical protein
MKWTVALALLVIVLAGWVIYQIVAGDLAPPSVPILGIGPGFEGDLALPKAEIDAALNAAREKVLSAADHGYDFRIGSRVAAWLAFLATAAITLVAGWYGQAPAAASPGGALPAAGASGLPRNAARIVAVLAATAAVLTAGGGLATQEAEGLSTWARDRQRDVIEARTKVLTAKTAEDARTVLEDLALKLKQ